MARIADERAQRAADPREAKRPITILAGPYGHPVHPALVTVPIGAWIASFVFDLASKWAGEGVIFVKGAFWLIGIGAIGAVVAALFGVMDLLTIPRGTPAFRTGLVHAGLNDLVLITFVVSFFIRRDRLDEPEVAMGLIVLSAVALAVLSVSGFLGGRLAYRYGVRVAAETEQADGFTK